MYNRYIPQPDGSYRRSQYPDRRPPASPPKQERPPEPAPDPTPVQTLPTPCHQRPRRPSGHCPPPKPPQEPAYDSTGPGIGSFLKHLLPGNFDTEDLLVVVLLLLMSGDCQEERNLPLLTLALYLFL